MKRFLHYSFLVFFRALVWCFISSNFQFNNLLIGLMISSIIPHSKFIPIKLNTVFKEIFKTIICLPQAIIETFSLISIKKPKEVYIETKTAVPQNSSQFINFVDLLRITITPLSLVTKRINKNTWRVHLITRGEK